MIVFTATHKETGKIFVGSARDSMEVTWAQLLNQADDGASGDFFAIIRAQGAASFELEEWAYAEDSRELRELMREAQQELGAAPIKGSSPGSATARPVPQKSNSAAARVREELRELMAMEAGPAEDDEPFSDWLASRRDDKKPSVVTPAPKSEQVNSSNRDAVGIREPSVESRDKTSAPASSVKPLPTPEKMANGRSGSASKEKRIREAIDRQRQEREQMRQTRSTEEAAEMKALMMGIEARRLASRKKPSARKSATGKTGKSGSVTAKAAVSKTTGLKSKTSVSDLQAERSQSVSSRAPSTVAPVAKGRTGSASKEKRIKEAIAREKAEREAQRQTRATAEADEMAAILARLDERNKAAAKIKRRR